MFLFLLSGVVVATVRMICLFVFFLLSRVHSLIAVHCLGSIFKAYYLIDVVLFTSDKCSVVHIKLQDVDVVKIVGQEGEEVVGGFPVFDLSDFLEHSPGITQCSRKCEKGCDVCVDEGGDVFTTCGMMFGCISSTSSG